MKIFIFIVFFQPTTATRAAMEVAIVSWHGEQNELRLFSLTLCGNRCSFFFFFLNCLIDNLYGNNSAGPAANAADPSGSDNAGYNTFYPDNSSVSSAPAHTHTHTHTPGTNDGATNNAGNYKAMPPPADKESPYSYGYGEEKKKILTQSEGQGDNYSMYSTAYPSSVTGGQGYNNYGK